MWIGGVADSTLTIVVRAGEVWETRGGKPKCYPNEHAFALSLKTLEWRRLSEDEAADA